MEPVDGEVQSQSVHEMIEESPPHETAGESDLTINVSNTNILDGDLVQP